MKNLPKIFLVVVAAILFTVPETACSQILTVCRRFIAAESCYKCSDYFYVNSEDEAQSRCAQLRARPYYFRSFRAYERWLLGNCPCKGRDPEPR
jgi:hypothetical protein